MPQNFTLPPGRYVQGNPYKLMPRTDQNNAPVIGKDGKQVHSCYIAVAIPKTVAPGNWWWHEAWGGPIFQLGAAEMPQNYQHKDFAWKIEDGDSTEPNKKGKRNCDREGFPGNWIVKAQSSLLPQFCTLLDPSKPGKPVALLQEGAIQAGSYVQLNVGCAGNKRTDSPGIYVNPNIVCLIGYGPVISFGIDPDDAGFGGYAAPAGASATPVGVTATPAPAPAHPAPSPAPAPAPTPALAPAPVPTQPHTAITMPPAPSAVPAAPAVPVAPTATPGSAYNRTAKWPAGIDDAGMAQAGWNELSLRQHGYIV